MTHSVTRSSPADGIVVNSQTGLISASFSNPLNSSIPAVATNISIGLQAQNGDVDDDPGQYSVSITAFDSEGQTVWSNNYQVQSAATAINVSIPFPTFAYGFYIAISSSIAGEPDGDDGITLTTISYQLPSCEFVNLESSLQILTVPSYADEGSSAISAGEPVDPSNGNEYTTEEDISAVALGNPPSFRRYYNSLDTTGSGDMGPGWRHSYSRKLVLPPTNIAYNSQPASPQSNLYPDVASACQQGWLDIRNNAPKAMWTVAATYDTSTGICNLSNGAILVVYSTDPPTPAPQYNFIHAIRDDGHVLDFTVNGSNFTAEAGVVERLSYSPYGGFMLVDGNDTTEYYDPSGKLVGIVDRAGNRLSIYLGLPEGITSGNGKIIDQFGRGVIVNSQL